jgi:hypothetical protein
VPGYLPYLVVLLFEKAEQIDREILRNRQDVEKQFRGNPFSCDRD